MKNSVGTRVARRPAENRPPFREGKRRRWSGQPPAIGLLVGAMALAPVGGAAQTLDQAVIEQLQEVGGSMCVQLLGGDLPTVLTGPLRDSVCNLGGLGGSAGSRGGVSATSQTTPEVIQKRLKETREEKDPAAAKKSAGETEAIMELMPGLSLFFSGEFESLDRDRSTFEAGFDSDIWRVTGGADYQFTRNFLAGLALTHSSQDGDFDGSGGFDNDSLGFLAFASFVPMDQSFIEISVGHASKNSDRDRFASFTQGGNVLSAGRVGADFDSDEVSAGISGGYDFSLNNFTFGPRAGLEWIRTEFDDYGETGGTGLELSFHDDDETSLLSTIGLRGSMVFNTDFAVLIPQASLDWKHEFEKDQRTIQVSFVGDTRGKRFTFTNEEPDRDFFEISAGLSAVMPHGIQAFANYRTLVGHAFYDSHVFSAGLRFEL